MGKRMRISGALLVCRKWRKECTGLRAERGRASERRRARRK